MVTETRARLLERLAAAIEAVNVTHPVRVAVDGRPAAGKTILADELALVLQGRGRKVIRATIEGFLQPRAKRYRRGVDSPEGCYLDSFDFEALRRVLLLPLGPGGDRRFQQAVYDRDADMAVFRPIGTAAVDAVLIFDGVFLLRPELIDNWDLSIFVSVDFERTLARAQVRDLVALGSAARVEERFRKRYLPSQEFYLDTVRPTELADIIVDNHDPYMPAWDCGSSGRP